MTILPRQQDKLSEYRDATQFSPIQYLGQYVQPKQRQKSFLVKHEDAKTLDIIRASEMEIQHKLINDVHKRIVDCVNDVTLYDDMKLYGVFTGLNAFLCLGQILKYTYYAKSNDITLHIPVEQIIRRVTPCLQFPWINKIKVCQYEGSIDDLSGATDPIEEGNNDNNDDNDDNNPDNDDNRSIHSNDGNNEDDIHHGGSLDSISTACTATKKSKSSGN